MRDGLCLPWCLLIVLGLMFKELSADASGIDCIWSSESLILTLKYA